MSSPLRILLTGSLLLLLLGNITPAQAVPLEPAETNIFSMPGYTRGLLAYAKHRVRYSSIGRVVFGAPMGSPSFCPLSPKPGTIIELGGGPWVGTHQNSTMSDRSGGWQSENGYDVYAEDGSAVHAVVDGTICTTFNFGLSRDCGVGKRGLYGNRMHLCGEDGNIYYYMHLDHRDENIYVTQKTGRVAAGHVLGLVGTFQECSGIRDHLHWSILASPWESWKCTGPSDSRCPSEVIQFNQYNRDCQASGWSGAIPPPVGGGSPPVQPPPPSGDPVVTAWPQLPVVGVIFGDDAVPAMEFCFDPSDGAHPPGRDVVECIPDDPQCRDNFCSGTCAQSGDSCSYTWDDRGQFCTYVEHCEQHGVCENSSCVLKEGRLGQTKREERNPFLSPVDIGVGERLCEFDSDCKAFHTTCRGSQCVEVPGSGENECQLGTNVGCPEISHYSCVSFSGVGGTLGAQCSLVPGSGPNECSPETEAVDCNLPNIFVAPLACGNGVCENSESAELCPSDCANPQTPINIPSCLDRETVFVCGLPEVAAGYCTSFQLGETLTRPGPDGIYDMCGEPTEEERENATVVCGDIEDCLREERTVCTADRRCVVKPGPGINACGNPEAPNNGACDYAGSCPLGTGYCSPEYLAQFWGWELAYEASQICRGESAGKVFAINDSCLCGTSQEYLKSPKAAKTCEGGPTGDWSVGLFQNNLLSGKGTRTRCSAYLDQQGFGAGRGLLKIKNTKQCRVVDEDLLRNVCEPNWGLGDPVRNIEKAIGIYERQSFCAWSPSRRCGICT